MKARSWTAGRTGVGFALAATTVAAMTVPAAAAPVTGHQPATLGATALAMPRVTAPTALPQAPTAMSYRVQAGDTVSHISARTGTSVSAIVRANNLNSRALIKAGQLLRIPVPGATAAAPSSSPSRSTAATSRSHTVAAGDTVSALAKRYGASISSIVSANELDSRALIIVGQQLTIPGRSSGGGSASAVSSAGSSSSGSSSSGSSSAGRSHTVAAGDTVSALAKRYGSSVSAITSANDLGRSAMIRVGQRLTIPSSSSVVPVSSIVSTAGGGSSSGSSSSGSSSAARSHTVAAGDTVSALAQRYGSSVSAITSANRLSSGAVIFVGQRLTIPAGSSGGGSSSSSSSASSSSSGEQLVGDTFLGRTYASAVVGAANTNKATLNSMTVPSRDSMRQIVRETAVQMGVDPALALAVAQQESGFDARAVSPANAVGTMQVIPSSGVWASDLVGRELNLLDPRDNVVAGVAILRQLRRAAPSLDVAIAGYYQGLAGVTRNGMYPDTRNYVAGIRNLMGQY
ncbi:LysM peptidoglycan-binding domain-containing protein [Georgenia sp. MJ173]|uniref:LysM peptidoglycan-binding domain-containing protein n=1 Tax=Georgenia sunbinii TaxID=3117728 RepID=UPI002F260A2A